MLILLAELMAELVLHHKDSSSVETLRHWLEVWGHLSHMCRGSSLKPRVESLIEEFNLSLKQKEACQVELCGICKHVILVLQQSWTAMRPNLTPVSPSLLASILSKFSMQFDTHERFFSANGSSV